MRTPRQLELTRKRKLATNPPPKGKCSSTGGTSKATITIKPDHHVRQYPGEHFTVSNGKLLCEACREQLNLKKSSINNHIHLQNTKKEKLGCSKRRKGIKQ